MVVSLAAGLDHFRAAALRITLRYRPARAIFISRSSRLFCFFLASLLANFLLACIAPLWLAVLGPIFVSIPHLFSGIRYLSRMTGPEPEPRASLRCHFLPLAFSTIIFGVALIRVSEALGNTVKWIYPLGMRLGNGVELGAMLLLIPILAFASRSRAALRKFSLAAGLFLLVMAGSWKYPLWTLGVLALGHHGFAFLIWFRTTRTRGEARIVAICFGLFVFASCLFFTLPSDGFIYQLAGRIPFPAGALLDLMTVVTRIFPTLPRLDLAWPLLQAYAFGQAIHYFVWLKAIPEQAIAQQVPLSFQQSLRALRSELGARLAWLAIATSLAFLGSILFFRLEWAREMYLAIATSHGYLEIAAFPFLGAAAIHDRSPRWT